MPGIEYLGDIYLPSRYIHWVKNILEFPNTYLGWILSLEKNLYLPTICAGFFLFKLINFDNKFTKVPMAAHFTGS